MRTLFVDPPPVVEDLIAQRRALGQDLYDEVWEGEYHVAPAPRGTHARAQARLLRLLGPPAEVAGLDGGGPVEEVLIVDPEARTVEWFERGDDGYRPVDASSLLGITSAEVTAAIDRPR